MEHPSANKKKAKLNLRDGVHGDFVSLAVRLGNGRVVGVLVRDEISRLDVTPVRVLALAVEDLLVQVDVVVVDGIVERDGDHHRDVLRGQVPGNGGTVLGAEAIGQHAHGGIAGWRAVGIALDVCEGGEKENEGMNTYVCNLSCRVLPSRQSNFQFKVQQRKSA